jgi:predicted nucleic acid-binding protein
VGLKADLAGSRVYFDANIFIYLLEGFEEFQKPIADIQALLAMGEIQVFTSELTLCEILVPAFRKSDLESVLLYRNFVEASGAFELVPTTRESYVRASFLRATVGAKTPDAIHLDAAMTSNCSVFLTNDRNLKVPKGIRCVHMGAET